MTNHHTYNHSPRVEKFPAINPNTVRVDQDQVTDPIPVRRFTAPGFDAGETSIVDLQSLNQPTERPAEPRKKPSWELIDDMKRKSAENRATENGQGKTLAAKALKAFGIKKSAK